jgi:hypothetical protein
MIGVITGLIPNNKRGSGALCLNPRLSGDLVFKLSLINSVSYKTI